MINLLPTEEKKQLFLDKRRKLTIVFNIVILVALICLNLILLSIKFYVLADVDIQKNVLDGIKNQSESPEYISFSETIKKYNATIGDINSFYLNKTYFSHILETILNIQKPENLYLTNFSIEKQGGQINVNISGASDSRDDLLIFKKNLEETPQVKNLLFSKSSWVSPYDVKFSLTFQIHENEE
jgi:hypothetical protein